jgi:FkbM family methyltransferase
MKLSDWVVNFSYHHLLIKIVRFLHLRGIMRKVYFLSICPKERILTIEVEGIKAQFYVRTPLELRTVGVISQEQLLGERLVLKKILQLLKQGETVYDVGANLGIHAIFMAKHLKNTGRVIAFEPESKSYEALLDNIKLNKLENVTALQLALGDRISEGKLHWKDKIVGSYSLIGERKEDVVNQLVKIFPGDFLAKRENLPFPEAVKIDVEGYEYQVITGMKDLLSNQACRMVCCEIHPGMFMPGINSDMVVQLLKNYGFKEFENPRSEKTFHLFCYKK